MTQLAKQNIGSLSLNSLQEVSRCAEILAKSTMIPRHYQNKSGDILVAIQMGSEIGLKPIQALQNIAVINGRPSVYGDALIALVQNNPLCEYVHEEFNEETMTAICKVKRKGDSEYVLRFGEKDAKQAGLWGKSGPWAQYPKRMLQMRARGFALRDKFADVLGGLITVEEARDYPTDVTPAAEKPEKQDLSSKLDNMLLEQAESSEEIEEEKTDTANMELAQLVVTHNVPSETIQKWCSKANVDSLEELPEEKCLNCINYILNNYQQVVDIKEVA